METRTEYGVKGTVGKHGKWQVTIETCPGNETDRGVNVRAMQRQRAWQARAGLEPDAELVTRTVTYGDWTAV